MVQRERGCKERVVKATSSDTSLENRSGIIREGRNKTGLEKVMRV